jgi:hypothetical protein
MTKKVFVNWIILFKKFSLIKWNMSLMSVQGIILFHKISFLLCLIRI